MIKRKNSDNRIISPSPDLTEVKWVQAYLRNINLL